MIPRGYTDFTVNDFDESQGVGWAKYPPKLIITPYLEQGSNEIKLKGVYEVEAEEILGSAVFVRLNPRPVFWITASENQIISTENNWLTEAFRKLLIPDENDQIVIDLFLDRAIVTGGTDTRISDEWNYFNMPVTIDKWVPSHIDWESPPGVVTGVMSQNRVYSYFPDLIDFDGAGNTYFSTLNTVQSTFWNDYYVNVGHAFFTMTTLFSADLWRPDSGSGRILLIPDTDDDNIEAWQEAKTQYVKPIGQLDTSFLIRRVSLTVAAILEEIYEHNLALTNTGTMYRMSDNSDILFPTRNGIGLPIMVPRYGASLGTGEPYVIQQSCVNAINTFLNTGTTTDSKWPSLINFFRYGLNGDGWENTVFMTLFQFDACERIIRVGNNYGGAGVTDEEYEPLYYMFQTPYLVLRAIQFIFENFPLRMKKLIKFGHFFDHEWYTANSSLSVNNSNVKMAHSLAFLGEDEDDDDYDRLDHFVATAQDEAGFSAIPISEQSNAMGYKYSPTDIVNLNRLALKTSYDLFKPAGAPSWPIDEGNTNAYEFAHLYDP